MQRGSETREPPVRQLSARGRDTQKSLFPAFENAYLSTVTFGRSTLIDGAEPFAGPMYRIAKKTPIITNRTIATIAVALVAFDSAISHPTILIGLFVAAVRAASASRRSKSNYEAERRAARRSQFTLSWRLGDGVHERYERNQPASAREAGSEAGTSRFRRCG